MKAVFKYKLESIVTNLWLPIGARVISANTHGSDIFIWAVADGGQSVTKESRHFVVTEDGKECPALDFPTYSFIGTVFMFDESRAYHVFEDFVPINARRAMR